MNCHYEQAVYGSFPFREGGYAPLAHSPRCQPDWLDAFHRACREIGEKPRGAGNLEGMIFARRIEPRGPWMIVGVSSPGVDDRGRPDALAFHGLFVDRAEFQKAAYNPFVLAPALREDWHADTNLIAGQIAVEADSIKFKAPDNPRAAAIAAVLMGGSKVAIASEFPIVQLAREVWDLLPMRTRERCSVANWAFANDAHFDLVATPSLAAWELDSEYVDPFTEQAKPPRRPVRRSFVVATVLAVLGLGISNWWTSRREQAQMISGFAPEPPRTDAQSLDLNLPNVTVKDGDPAPDRASYTAEDASPDQAREIGDRLTSLYELVHQVGPPVTRLPTFDRNLDTRAMQEIHPHRYKGPLLSNPEIAAIAKSSSEGRSRALAWDRHIRLFLDNRPLPADFASGPLRWQIDTLAWSFHVDPDPHLTTLEAIDAIADALKLDEPIRPNPLASKYPALAEYAKFLGRLPLK